MSQFKRKLSAFTAMLAFVAFAGTQITSAVTIQDNTYLGGTSGFEYKVDGNTMYTNNTTGTKGGVAWGNFGRFNLGENEKWINSYSNVSQINGVTVYGDPSRLYGQIISNGTCGPECGSFGQTGNLILINPAGVMFGAGSTVDVNSFTVSTHDFRGAKYLKDMSEAEKEAYQKNVLNKMSSNPALNGEGRNYALINFDSNYTESFKQAGVKYTPGATEVILDGATFAHFNSDGSIADFNPNKSLAIVSDNIKYQDSLIKTGTNHNYTSPSGSSSFSNVRLITADGVTFSYLANGYVDDYKVAADTKNVERKIDINNSGLAANQPAIESGNIHIVNKSNNTNSNVKISNTVVKGTKLVNKENGDIMILSPGDIDITDSRLAAMNTSFTKNGTTYSTHAQAGGEVAISAGKNVTVKDSFIGTAGSKAGTNKDTKSGDVRIYANNGNANITGTEIASDGNVDIAATGKLDVKGSFVQAKNTVDTSLKKSVQMLATDGVNVHNSVIDASKDVKIAAIDANSQLSGDVIISSDLKSNGQNQTLVVAESKLSIQGKNTKLDNASLAYDHIKFYNDGTTGTNNVTVANNTTFAKLFVNDEGKLQADPNIELETNGDFTLDNATMKRAGHSLAVVRDEQGRFADDGTKDALKYTLNITTGNAKDLTVKSTQGNVNVKNNSNIKATNDINLIADSKDVNVNSSKMQALNNINITGAKNAKVESGSELIAKKDINITAKNDDVKVSGSKLGGYENVNIVATKGGANITDNTEVVALKDLNVTAYDTITFGNQGEANIDNTVKLAAQGNMNITSTGGNIVGEKTTMPTLSYGDRLTFNAKESNIFTSEDSLKAVDVDFIAGKSNNITTKGDIQLVNTSLKSPKNNITTTQEGGDVILNNVTLKQATTNAKDTVTKISAKGNVTTKDVTGTANQTTTGQKTFPQSVNFEGKVTDKTVNDTVLDVNKTKLVVETKVGKTTPKNNDNGSITLTVKNADNKDAGVDLTAQNDSWDEQIDKGEGPEVHLHAQDGKVAISNIDTDKLTLTKENKFIAATDAPNGTPTITIKDKGGFNLDPSDKYDPKPDGFTYDKNKEESRTEDTVRIWDEEKGEYVISQTDIETVYGKDYVDRTTITTVEKEHEIHFGEDGDQKFNLVYEKTNTEIIDNPGTVTRTETICPEMPDVDRNDDTDVDSYINQIKLPREQVEISKTSKVSDNTVDQTSSIMSAAAKVDLGQEVNATYSTDKDDKDEEQ